MTTINLEGRYARCTCGSTRPSEPDMGYFEYRGDGSRAAIEYCAYCGHTEASHDSGMAFKDGYCGGFTPRGAMDYDSFFCGHLSGQ